jgi:hypothetical protein
MRIHSLAECVIICSLLVLSACQKDLNSGNKSDGLMSMNTNKGKQDLKENTFKGPEIPVGEGYARTFATITHSGVPIEIGVMFTDEALSGLPHSNTLYQLEFHHKAIEATLFEHVLLGLSAHGHPLSPSGTIGAHFDVRFMMMTQAERLALPAPTSTAFNAPGGGGYDVMLPGHLPAKYVWNAPLPQIGRHWNEAVTDPGLVVPHTMIYGTWNGALNFINPIVTLTTLASGTSQTVAYPQPQIFAEHGYYATKYNIYEDDKGRHYVSLSHFVWR